MPGRRSEAPPGRHSTCRTGARTEQWPTSAAPDRTHFLHNLTLDAEWARILGSAVLAASTVFTLWARFALGTMWSVAPEVGGDRHLRTSGPYGVTRHPIYSGLVGMLLGTMLLAGVHEFIVLVPAALALFEVKIRQEGRLMLEAFPNEYPDYRRQVPQIVPGLRLLRH